MTARWRLTRERDDGVLLGATFGVGDAFDVFYRRHREAVFAYLARRTSDTQTALDLTAEVFAAAYLRRERYDAERGPARAWLFGIAANKAADAWRRGRRETAARRKLGIARREYTDSALEQAEGLINAETLLAGLPERERDAVWARVVEDRSYPDIAADANVSPATIRKRVSQGLAALPRA